MRPKDTRYKNAFMILRVILTLDPVEAAQISLVRGQIPICMPLATKEEYLIPFLFLLMQPVKATKQVILLSHLSHEASFQCNE